MDKLEVTGRDGTRYVLDNESGEWEYADGDLFDILDAVCDALLAARREWVPCGERLPERYRDVWVAARDSAGDYTCRAAFNGTDWRSQRSWDAVACWSVRLDATPRATERREP